MAGTESERSRTSGGGGWDGFFEPPTGDWIQRLPPAATLLGVFEAIGDIVWVLDRNNRGVYVNPRFEQVLGWPRPEVIGREVYEFLDAPNREILERQFREKRDRGQSSSYLIRALHRNGFLVPLMTTGAPLLRGQELLGKVAVMRDARIRVALLEEVERRGAALAAAYTTLQRTTQMIVHDLRGPLSSLKSNVSYLRDAAPGGTEEAEEALEEMGDEVRWMEGLVDDLLLVARSEGGALPLKRERVALEQSVAEGWKEVEGTARLRGVTVELTGRGMVEGDRKILRRLFANLAKHGLKHSPDGAALRIQIQAFREGWIRVTVSDRGRGVPLRERERALDPEEAGGGASTSGGVGLTFCRIAAQAHGGTLHMEEAEGGGARLVLDLPVDPSTDRPL